MSEQQMDQKANDKLMNLLNELAVIQKRLGIYLVNMELINNESIVILAVAVDTDEARAVGLHGKLNKDVFGFMNDEMANLLKEQRQIIKKNFGV